MSLLLSTALLDQDPTAAGGSQLRYSDDPQVRRYASAFADVMEMRGSAGLVSDYLDDHGSWFRRCAAPMTGRVVEVRVAAGDPVSAGDTLVILEAMKMEHRLQAQADGIVRAVRVQVGQTVDPDDVLVVVAPVEDQDGR